MINEATVRKYCREDISRIENYDKAIADKTKTWDCHHRLELTLDGEFAHTRADLKRLDMYYNRPYYELIFLTHAEHTILHQKGSKHSEETKQKISEAKKGKIRKEFGEKFKEHFGITRYENIKLYDKELMWYRRHNHKCRWEI